LGGGEGNDSDGCGSRGEKRQATPFGGQNWDRGIIEKTGKRSAGQNKGGGGQQVRQSRELRACHSAVWMKTGRTMSGVDTANKPNSGWQRIM